MKIPRKILLIIIPILFAGSTCLAQVKSQQMDNSMVVIKKKVSAGDKKSQDIETNNNQHPGRVENPGSHEIKRLKTARPDMSKARGARPPDIVRPSGSRFPRGLGKPGGFRQR